MSSDRGGAGAGPCKTAQMQRLRGLKALIHDAVDQTADLVREGHESTARAVQGVIEHVAPLAGPVRTINAVRRVSTAGVLNTIKIVNRAVEVVSDAGMDLVTRLLDPEGTAGAEGGALLRPALPMRSDAMKSAGCIGDAALGLVNAAVGDYLYRRSNGLDLGMAFRVGDQYVPLTRDALTEALRVVSPKVALFLHGLGTTEWSWCLEAAAYHGDPGASFGSLLARDLGYTPVWLRYNSGRHISENGRLLAAELERFVAAYPRAIEEFVLVGHSMGGLVARSACHYASEEGLRWVSRVRRVFCLGSPHHGAPLEKLTHVLTSVLGAIDLPGTRIPAQLLRGRSAGIKDLRHGALVDEDWLGRDPDALCDPEMQEVPLLPDVSYHFISATVTADPEHPIGRLIGDLLVRVPSSSGPATSAGTFPIETRRFGGVLHHQLQNHPAVYKVLRDACGGGVGRMT